MKRSDVRAFNVSAAPPLVWATIWDIPAIASCIPGCESIHERSPMAQYEVAIRRSVGPFLVRMAVDVEVVASRQPSAIVIRARGEDPRLRSTMTLGLTIRIEGQPGRSEISVATELELLGTLVSLGERLVGQQIEREMETFVESLRHLLERRAAGAGGDTTPSAIMRKERDHRAL